jgi:hypothetical protein
MVVQVITLGIPEFQGVVTEAYKEGYLKAQREFEAEKEIKINQPKFGEIIRGCKELHHYLTYKEFWRGSLSTLSKIAPQLLDKDEKIGHGLIFRRGCIDHAFENGFRFTSSKITCEK